MTNCVIGLFHDPQSALVAAGELKSAGFETPELMSPVPIEGVEEVLGKKKSIIKTPETRAKQLTLGHPKW